MDAFVCSNTAIFITFWHVTLDRACINLFNFLYTKSKFSYCEFEYSVANKPSQLGTDFAGTLHLRVRPIE